MSNNIVSSSTGMFLSREQVEKEIFKAIELSDKAQGTKRQYKRALTRYIYGDDPDNTEPLRSLLDVEDLLTYCTEASQSAKAMLKAAIGAWVDHSKLVLMSKATPETVDTIQATMWRLDAMSKAIKVPSQKGKVLHTWLSKKEVDKLLTLPPKWTRKGMRDRVLLSLLVLAGLRREEAVSVEFSHITEASIGNGETRRILNVYGGKGDKDRYVPISDRFGELIDRWAKICGNKGYLLRQMDRYDKIVGDSLTGQSLYMTVREYSDMMGKRFLPHDLRRTFAEHLRQDGVPVEEIQKLLGHDSLLTTQRYLQASIDLKRKPLDYY